MILVDTGPLVALADSRDQHARWAAADWRRLRRRRLALVVPVLVEAFALLAGPVQRVRLRAVIVELEAAIWSGDDAELVPEILTWLERYEEHSPDWADATLAVLSGRDTNIRVWTFDSEFATTWRRPNGTKIPLAVPPA